ncbi:MAG: hypothetical protein HGGPFJEG_02193 [Ignavibacteria bacterium]|nr:hypothetical protein [Ignavibacteria bacterium]
MSYSVDLSIPVEIKTSSTQALTDELPSSIDVTVRGKGWELIGMLISKNTKYTLDISKYKKDSKILTENFVSDKINLNPNVSVLNITPDTINISFDKISEKLVPVRNRITVKPKDGYGIAGKPVLKPDSVKVRGSSYILNKIKFISTEDLVFNDVNSELSGKVRIMDTLSNIISIEPKILDFSYSVQLTAEKYFEDVTVEVSGLPEDKEVLLLPPKVNLSIRGGINFITGLTQADINVKVEFNKIEIDTLGFLKPEVSVPEGLEVLSMNPEKLQYIIKKKL